MDLFEQQNREIDQPLAERLRPKSMDDMVGQAQLFRNNKLLLNRLAQGHLQSLILWGPPGCGKTSFANALLNEVKAEVVQENAIDLGAKRIREVGVAAKRRLLEHQQKTVVFVDEIHRLNRGQQDVLLPFVEKGYFYLIGATTENPSYQLNAALISRCRLLIFEPLKPENIEQLIDSAFLRLKLTTNDVLSAEAKESLIEKSHGDARRLLNLLEEVVFSYQNESLDGALSLEQLNSLFQSAGIRFDKKGDEHYDIISAFIKSIRGSDPDAGIYYLARMLEGGEDPLFIARRLVVLASEDIGNADPQALLLATSTLQAVQLVGMPEARINLAQAVTYLASCPKSNRSYTAINKAMALVKATGPLPVPKALRSAQTKLMKQIGYGEGYKYSHDGQTGWLEQDFLPVEIKDEKFYEPVQRGFEKRISEYLKWMRGEKKD